MCDYTIAYLRSSLSGDNYLKCTIKFGFKDVLLYGLYLVCSSEILQEHKWDLDV